MLTLRANRGTQSCIQHAALCSPRGITLDHPIGRPVLVANTKSAGALNGLAIRCSLSSRAIEAVSGTSRFAAPVLSGFRSDRGVCGSVGRGEPVPTLPRGAWAAMAGAEFRGGRGL
jgi:hypothetical protein